MNGPGCIATLGIIAIAIMSIVMAGGQAYQGVTKDVSVQVCDDFGNCRWEIQTVLK